MLLDVVRSCIVVDTIEEMNHVVKLIVEDQVCASVAGSACKGWLFVCVHALVSLTKVAETSHSSAENLSTVCFHVSARCLVQ